MLQVLAFNLLDDRCRAVCADLREAAHVGNIEAHGNDGVSSAALRLGHDSAHCVVASAVELGRGDEMLASAESIRYRIEVAK